MGRRDGRAGAEGSMKLDDWTTEEGLAKVESWARCGLTDKAIAHNMGISEATFKRWKKESMSFLSSLKKGREVADVIVEDALFKAATGYEYVEITEKPEYNRTTGKTEMVEVKRVIKWRPSDATACIFWLKNRAPEFWSDRPERAEDLTKVKEILNGIHSIIDSEVEK